MRRGGNPPRTGNAHSGPSNAVPGSSEINSAEPSGDTFRICMLTDGAESGTTSPPLLDTCPIDDESPTTDVLYCRYRRAPSVPASSFVRPSLVTCLAPESFKGAGTTVSEYTNAANASTATPTGPTSQG